jgi:putative membrane-bound dehydrogenase-like protein
MRFLLSTFAFSFFASAVFAQQETPKAADPRLVVELVAAAPDIVHPIACDFDAKGRLLVIESHTHFAPKDYKGPQHDRIRAFDVKNGKASTFFEGTRHTMDLAVHPDDSVYIATRNEILRLRETKDGVKSERIVFCDTKGDYPHNGLSGLCFDSKGDLYFGMGENLGVFFKMIGSDGKTITDEQGGHIFHCSADGKNLRRVATGFWNPFGICRDIYGRVFAVDNDPDQSPPCRMVHVVEGGDYGFRFCYGRSGKHPFQSWHGELPGTLPMMTGVGEAPCEILSYESDGLPKEYLGKLMVTSWADHRVELYKVAPHGASFKAERQPFVQGGNNFRPVGLCVAPDGSLYVTDWVLPNYELHRKGAIWHIRWKDDQSRERKRPVDPREAILSLHRLLREAAAKKLAGEEKGREFLRKQLEAADSHVRAAALTALIDTRNFSPNTSLLELIVRKSPDLGFRELALRELVRRRELKDGIISEKTEPILRAIALAGTGYDGSYSFKDKDPFLRHAAVRHFAQSPYVLLTIAPDSWKNREFRLVYFLATRRPSLGFLKDTDEDLRFLAVKEIADRKIAAYRDEVEELMANPKLSVRIYLACATALARIDGKEVSDKSLADYFAKQLADDSLPNAQRAMLLRQVPANHPKVTLDLLRKFLAQNDDSLRFEAVRALVDHPTANRDDELEKVLDEPRFKKTIRAYATIGISDQSSKKVARYLDYADGPLGDDVLRALIGATFTRKQREILVQQESDGIWADGVRRALGKPFFKDRPPHKDIDAWMKRLEGKADPDAGARVFFHPKLAGCYKCHRIDGRGQDVGPDLSNIGRTDRRHILESILQPSNTVAPHYVAWHLETADGKVRNGMLLHTHLDEYTYLDAKGDRFKIKTGGLVEQRPLAISIMPDGLVDRMTDQEVRDLLEYLESRK